MAATRAATHRWHQNSEESKGQICHVLPVTNVTSLGEVTQKVWRSILLQSLGSTDICQIQSNSWWSCCHGRQMIGQESVIHLHLAPGAWQTIRFKNRGNKRREFIFIVTVISCFFEKKKKKRQRYNHALTDPLEREKDCSPERSLLSECLIHLALAENRHFNMTSRYIRVSLSTGIHATTMQRGVVAALKVERNFATRFTWSDPKWSKVGSQHQKTVVVHWETPSCKCEKVS